MSQKQRGMVCPEGSKELVRLQCKILCRVPGNEIRDGQGEPLEVLKQPTGMVTVLFQMKTWPHTSWKQWKVRDGTSVVSCPRVTKLLLLLSLNKGRHVLPIKGQIFHWAPDPP